MRQVSRSGTRRDDDIVSNDSVIPNNHCVLVLEHRITNENGNLVLAHQV